MESDHYDLENLSLETRPKFVALITNSRLKKAQRQKVRPLFICNRVYIIY